MPSPRRHTGDQVRRGRDPRHGAIDDVGINQVGDWAVTLVPYDAFAGRPSVDTDHLRPICFRHGKPARAFQTEQCDRLHAAMAVGGDAGTRPGHPRRRGRSWLRRLLACRLATPIVVRMQRALSGLIWNWGRFFHIGLEPRGSWSGLGRAGSHAGSRTDPSWTRPTRRAWRRCWAGS